MNNSAIMSSQIAAARALTEVSQTKWAERAQVDLPALVNLEARRNVPNDPSAELSRIQLALEKLGAVFLAERDGAGVGRLSGQSQLRLWRFASPSSAPSIMARSEAAGPVMRAS